MLYPLLASCLNAGSLRLENSIVTAQVLRLYGIGILPLAMGGILLRCSYAVGNHGHGVIRRNSGSDFLCDCSHAFHRRFGIQGLALNYFYLVTGILVVVLWNRKHLLHFDLDMVRFIALTTVASLAMVAMNWISWHFFYLAFDRGGIAGWDLSSRFSRADHGRYFHRSGAIIQSERGDPCYDHTGADGDWSVGEHTSP